LACHWSKIQQRVVDIYVVTNCEGWELRANYLIATPHTFHCCFVLPAYDLTHNYFSDAHNNRIACVSLLYRDNCVNFREHVETVVHEGSL
jgi:hypothetical protein